MTLYLISSILVFILFRFDDGAKLKKRNSGDVSYLKKSVS